MWVLTGVLLAACNLTPKTDPAYAEAIPLDLDIRTGVLDNGLTYFIKKNSKPENRAEMRLVVNAGSIQEDPDQQGLAHFAEHMLFNGTENFKKLELIDFFELTGQKFGAHVNAYTSFDETVYMLKPRTDSAEIFDKAFQVLEDWAHLALFEDEEIDKERGVVVEEWRLRLGPDNRMMYQYLPVLFNNSRYAERLPIGKVDILETFSYDAIKRFYKDWYRPDLMAVIVVGDFDVEEVEEKIKTHFSGLTNPEEARPREVYDLPAHEETLVKVVSDQEASFSNVSIYYKQPRQTMATLGDYRTYLMNRLISKMLSQRYDELMQQENPPFVNASSYFGGVTRTTSAYTTSAFANEGEIDRGFRTILIENERMVRHGFTAGELQRAKDALMSEIENQYNERDKIESRSLAYELVDHFLEGMPAPGIAYEYEKASALMDGISLDEVNALPKNWMEDKSTVIIATGPDKEGVNMPAEDDLLAIYNEVKKMEIEPYEDNFQSSDLLVEMPEAGSVVGEETIDELGITQLTFSNGATVILKPTDFKNDEILVGAQSFGGTSLYADEDYFSAEFVTAIAAMSGISTFSATDLQKVLSGKNVELYAFIENVSEGVSGSTTPADLETYLQLQYLYFTAPRKDATSFASFRQQQKMIYQNLDANPQFYFMKQYMKALYQDHPRARVPEAADFDKVDLDRAFEIYAERFANAGDFTFFFVGNFDIATIKPLLATYIGGLPGESGNGESYSDVGIRYPDKAITEMIQKGTEPKSMVSMAFTGTFDWSYENRFEMLALADVLRIKLRESMREEKGGVYGVGVSAQPSQHPVEDYMFMVQWGCSPENVEELINTAMQEIANLKQNGATDKDLQKVRETMIRSRETDLKENSFWLSALQQYYKNGEDPRILLDYEQYVNGLTSDDIKAAANQYLIESRLLKFVMMPEGQTQLLN